MIWKRLPALALLLLLSSCGRQSSLSPRGPAAHEIGNIEWSVLILFCVITVVMWALIALIISRPRGSLTEHAPYDAGGGQNWIIIGGFTIPAVILAGIYIGPPAATVQKFTLRNPILGLLRVRNRSKAA